MQNGVGICEVSGFNRFEITGTDRYTFIDRMFCGNISKKDGRVGLGYMLNDYGMLKGEAAIANLPATGCGRTKGTRCAISCVASRLIQGGVPVVERAGMFHRLCACDGAGR